MGKFSLLLDGLVASTTMSAQENIELKANQADKSQAVVFTNSESYNYSKYTTSFMYINASDSKRFLNTLKDEDKDSSMQFISNWHRMLVAEKKRDVWGDKQLEGIEAITQYFYDYFDADPSNSKEWFRISAAKKGLLLRLEVRVKASWGAFGVNYEEEVEYYVNGSKISGSFTSEKIYESCSA